MRHDLPPAARALTAAVVAAVDAARAGDADAFAVSTARLGGLDPEHVRLVLGHVVRSLLEDSHPDGLDGDDVQAALERCVRQALGWLPDVDTGALVVMVTGALGVHDPEDVERRVTPEQVATSAPLLVATLLEGAPRPLEDHLVDAVGEVARAQTMEMP